MSATCGTWSVTLKSDSGFPVSATRDASRLSRAVTMLVLFAVCVGPPAAGAAEFRDKLSSPPPAERAEAFTAVLNEQLSLSADQQAGTREIAERHAAKIDEALLSYRRPELKKQIKLINAERDKELQSVLDESQYASYAANRKAILKSMRERLGKAPPPSATPG
jgi:hypothetical protein